MNHHKSTDYKLAAVQYYLDMNNPSLRKTCEIFKCSKYSLVRWVNRYIKLGTVENKKRKEGSYKVKKKHVQYILLLIKNKPSITLTDILSNFHQKFKDITLSKTHLNYIIKFSNITYKKVQYKHRPDTRYNKPINYDEEYAKFYNKIKKYNLDDIIAIDETSIKVGLSVNKGRNTIGKRINKKTTNNAVFVKYTLIMAITTKQIIGWALYRKGGIEHGRLIEFLKPLLKKRKNRLILMDNASAHRNQLVLQFINKSNNDYVHIIPYNHSQNPIERMFNQLKYYIKKDEPMSFDEIIESIKKASSKITEDNLKNYFNSSLNKTKKEIEETKTRYHKKPKIYKD